MRLTFAGTFRGRRVFVERDEDSTVFADEKAQEIQVRLLAKIVEPITPLHKVEYIVKTSPEFKPERDLIIENNNG